MRGHFGKGSGSGRGLRTACAPRPEPRVQQPPKPARVFHLKKGPRKPNPAPIPHRDLAERNQLLVQHLPQVQYIARSIHKRLPQHIPVEDLVSAGVLGLIEALGRFDPSKRIKLASYAKARIRGAILDSLRKLDWCPRSLRRKGREIGRATQRLGNRLGWVPSEAEVAGELGIALDRFQQLRNELYTVESANLPGPDPVDGEDPFSLCSRSEMTRILAQAIHGLSTRRRQVLTLYYFEEMTMKEVGARLQVTESLVSKVNSAALCQLRRRVARLLRGQPKPFPPGGQF